MNADFSIENILGDTLLPFLRTTFPDGHRFQQDNVPKHNIEEGKTVHGRKWNQLVERMALRKPGSEPNRNGLETDEEVRRSSGTQDNRGAHKMHLYLLGNEDHSQTVFTVH